MLYSQEGEFINKNEIEQEFYEDAKENISLGLDLFCIVVPYKTGIKYELCCGGYAVHQDIIEGYIFPLTARKMYRAAEDETGNCPGNPYWNCVDCKAYLDKLFCSEGSKYKGHCYSGIDYSDADYIDWLFKAQSVCTNGYNIGVDRTRLSDCQEAYIHVILIDDETGNETSAVLTWENSD